MVGVDFAQPMLALAQKKATQYQQQRQKEGGKWVAMKWLCGDVERLALPDGQFDRACCAFGMRNLQHPRQGLREAFRLLRSGGRLVMLEFFLPRKSLWAGAYGFYFRLVLPIIGSIMAHDRQGAYHYLPQSVRGFGGAAQLEAMLREAGFRAVQVEALAGGAVGVFSADKL